MTHEKCNHNRQRRALRLRRRGGLAAVTAPCSEQKRGEQHGKDEERKSPPRGSNDHGVASSHTGPIFGRDFGYETIGPASPGIPLRSSPLFRASV